MYAIDNILPSLRLSAFRLTDPLDTHSIALYVATIVPIARRRISPRSNVCFRLRKRAETDSAHLLAPGSIFVPFIR